MSKLKEQVAAMPRMFAIAGRFLSLLGKSDNPGEFLLACREADFERAFSTIDQSEEEIHEEVTAIREAATEIAVENPQLEERIYRETHE